MEAQLRASGRRSVTPAYLPGVSTTQGALEEHQQVTFYVRRLHCNCRGLIGCKALRMPLFEVQALSKQSPAA